MVFLQHLPLTSLGCLSSPSLRHPGSNTLHHLHKLINIVISFILLQYIIIDINWPETCSQLWFTYLRSTCMKQLSSCAFHRICIMYHNPLAAITETFCKWRLYLIGDYCCLQKLFGKTIYNGVNMYYGGQKFVPWARQKQREDGEHSNHTQSSKYCGWLREWTYMRHCTITIVHFPVITELYWEILFLPSTETSF